MYEKPQAEIILLDVQDVLVTSLTDGNGDNDDEINSGLAPAVLSVF